jgi:hypothetical protein
LWKSRISTFLRLIYTDAVYLLDVVQIMVATGATDTLALISFAIQLLMEMFARYLAWLSQEISG